jgi:hypothetical protein
MHRRKSMMRTTTRPADFDVGADTTATTICTAGRP